MYLTIKTARSFNAKIVRKMILSKMLVIINSIMLNTTVVPNQPLSLFLVGIQVFTFARILILIQMKFYKMIRNINLHQIWQAKN